MNFIKALPPDWNIAFGYVLGAVAFLAVYFKTNDATQATAAGGLVAVGVAHIWDTVVKASTPTPKGN